jgi:hypothetical protein
MDTDDDSFFMRISMIFIKLPHHRNLNINILTYLLYEYIMLTSENKLV